MEIPDFRLSEPFGPLSCGGAASVRLKAWAIVAEGSALGMAPNVRFGLKGQTRIGQR